jgi:hypothetical protein
MLVVIMAMGCDYVSELRPPMGLLLIPRWHVHGEPWWNYIDRGELLFSLPELSGIPTSNLVVKQELAKETLNFLPYEVSLFILGRDL